MKVYIKHIIIALLATMAVLSCNKNEPTLTGEPILMSFKEAGQTKALLDANTFVTPGNQVKVYDYYTQGPNSSVSTDYYISGDLAQSNGSSWPFVNNKYEWTPDGEHKFFGWLEKDNNNQQYPITASNFWGTNFLLQDQVLKIPKKTIGADTQQFDFMYSNIYVRDLNSSNPYFGAVPLEFKHLFTAFNVTARMDSEYSEVRLKSITISGLQNSRSATIDFSPYPVEGQMTTEPIISYANKGTSGQFAFTVGGTDGLVLETDQTYNVSNADFIMWEHINDTNGSTNDFLNAEARIVYVFKDKRTNQTYNIDKNISLSELGSWVGGTINNLQFVFKDKEIQLDCFVNDWQKETEIIEFSNQVTVVEGGKMEWENVSKVDNKTAEVLLYSDTEITAVCKFRIESPSGATWTASLISKEGHLDAFELVDGTKYGAVGVDSEIRIRVNNHAPVAPRHACILRITVQTADGRTIVVNDLLPDHSERPANITEYTIIQNLING